MLRQVEEFVLKALELEPRQFTAKRIDFVQLQGEFQETTKAKLVFFYLRSNENLPQVQEHILGQLRKLDFRLLEKASLRIVFRTALNLLGNAFYRKNKDLQF